jgi:hypothetical protein
MLMVLRPLSLGLLGSQRIHDASRISIDSTYELHIDIIRQSG